MVKLAVIADDLTGALDTGIKFSMKGIRTQVFTGNPIPFQEISKDTEAIIIDTETRHLDKDTAQNRIFHLACECMEKGIRRFYKKTDSALRGHIGAELTALYKAVEKPVRFVPALPKEDRYTLKGIHYIRGVPVSESIFGKDPFNPVPFSSVSRLIHMESDIVTQEIHGSGEGKSDAGIIIYDARSSDDLVRIGRQLKEEHALDITAGCAGFAEVLAEDLDFNYTKAESFEKKEKMIVLSGSINQVTGSQMDYARENGFFRRTLTEKEKLEESYLQTQDGIHFLKELEEMCRIHDRIIFDVFSPDTLKGAKQYAALHQIPEKEIAGRIAKRLGEIFFRLSKSNPESLIMIIGGDTLYASIQQYPELVLNPICEPAPGTVLIRGSTRDHNLSLLSKSGGFGEKDLLIHLSNQLMKGR